MLITILEIIYQSLLENKSFTCIYMSYNDFIILSNEVEDKYFHSICEYEIAISNTETPYVR